MSFMKFKTTFSLLVEADDIDQAIDMVAHDLYYLFGEYMIDKAIEISDDVESIFDLEEYQ